MMTLALVLGVTITALSCLTLFLGVRQVIRVRSHLRHTIGKGMPPLRAELAVLGGWSVALLVGLFLIWLSQR